MSEEGKYAKGSVDGGGTVSKWNPEGGLDNGVTLLSGRSVVQEWPISNSRREQNLNSSIFPDRAISDFFPIWDEQVMETITASIKGECLDQKDSDDNIWQETCNPHHFTGGFKSLPCAEINTYVSEEHRDNKMSNHSSLSLNVR